MRGEVYRLRRPKDSVGHEQDGVRYAVVVQSSDVLLSTWIVCPTSTRCADASFRPRIEISGRETKVMVDQVMAIDPQGCLGDPVEFLSLAAMQQIDDALRLLLDLGT